MRRIGMLIFLLTNSLAIFQVDADVGASSIHGMADAYTPEQLFERLVVMQDPGFRYTRDQLLSLGQAIMPMLEVERGSKDWRRRTTAEILILRLGSSAEVVLWERALRGYTQGQTTYQAMLDDPGQVKFIPQEPAPNLFDPRARIKQDDLGPIVILNRRAVPLLIEHLWLNSSDAHLKLVSLLGHLGDELAVRPLLQIPEPYQTCLSQACEDAIVAIGHPAVLPLIAALADESALEQLNIQAPRLWMACKLLGELGDASAVMPLVNLLSETPQHRTAAVAAEALAKLGAVESPPLIAKRLAEYLASITPQDYSGSFNYRDVVFDTYRRALRGLFSAGAAAAISQQRFNVEDVRWRFLLQGLTMELAVTDLDAHYLDELDRRTTSPFEPLRITGGDDVRRSVELGHLMVDAAWAQWHTLLRWHSWQWGSYAASIGREQAPGALEYLVDSIRSPGAIEGLALLGDPQAIAPLTELLTDRDSLAPEAVRAIYRIGGDQALSALQRARDRPRQEHPFGPQHNQEDHPLWRRLCAALIYALENRSDELAELLNDETVDVRHAAAESLVRLGDRRGAPLLLRQAVAADALEYLRLRALLLSLGQDDIPTFVKTEDPRESLALRVATEAMHFQLQHSDLCREFDRRLHEAWSTLSTYKVIYPQEILTAGLELGRDQPRELASYAEAYLLFRLGAGDVTTGVLAEFARDRSIPVLLEAVRRGLNPALAALALGKFGESGLAAARALPPPDPDKAAYTQRSARSTAGATALALAEDPVGLEHVIEALNSSWRSAEEPDGDAESIARRDAWLDRIRSMIHASGRYHDQRLFDAMYRLHGAPELHQPYCTIRYSLLQAMMRYEDARLIPLLKSTVLSTSHYIRDNALSNLANRKDVDVMEFLLDSLDPEKPEETRITAVKAMHRIFHPGFLTIPQDERDRWRKMARETEGSLHFRHSRRDALFALATQRWEQLLDDRSVAVQHQAAKALADYNVQSVSSRMAQWLSTEHPPPPQWGAIYQFLSRVDDESLDAKMLQIFTAHRWTVVAEALAARGYIAAAQELAAELRQPAKYQSVPRIADALLGLGPEGRELAGAVLGETLRRDVMLALLLAFERQGSEASEQWNVLAEAVSLLLLEPNKTDRFAQLAEQPKKGTMWFVQQAAIKAMATADLKRSIPVLRHLAIEHDDPLVRSLAVEVMDGKK